MIIHNIQSYIDTYNQNINLNNKKQYGEVFTPFTLINSMLDQLPNHIWKNPHLQWLDPANGTGHFMMIVYTRLWRELQHWEPVLEKLEAHILTHMLFMVEINESNIEVSRQVFGEKANIYHQCFFTFYQTFDIVVGNPPFNISREKTCGKTQWQHFVKRIISCILRDNGYLLFMHPPIWRKPSPDKSPFKDLFSLLAHHNQLLYLSIQNKIQGMKILDCNTRFDWYLLQKKIPTTNTIISDETGKMDEFYLPLYTWLPNSNITEIFHLTSVQSSDRIKVIYDRMAYKADQKNIPLVKQWVRIDKNEHFIYPLIHSTPKKGIQYRYSSVCDKGHFGIPKVIFGEGGIHHCIVDIKGEYGMTHGAMAIQVNNIEEGNLLRTILLSETFKKLMSACCYSSYRIDWCVLSEFSKEKLISLG